MSAVLEDRILLAPFDTAMTDQVLALAREMHAESVSHRDTPMDEAKLLAQLAAPRTNPDVYVKFAQRGDEVLGGFFGVVTPAFFSQERVARDMAWFVKKSHRGSSAAIRLLHDFEKWAKARGATKVFLGQSTGVLPEVTAALYEKLGYQTVGVNTVKAI